MNGPLHVEAVGVLKHGGDDKKIVYGDVSPLQVYKEVLGAVDDE
jgi:hypothetical protein